MQNYEQISNETAAIAQRLRQVASAHEALLSNLTSLTVAADSAVFSSPAQKNEKEINSSVHTKKKNKKRGSHSHFRESSRFSLGGVTSSNVNVASDGRNKVGQGVGIGPVASRRSMCTPLDGGGAASSAFSPDGSAVSALNLNPSERVVPSRIVPGIETASSIEKKVLMDENNPFTLNFDLNTQDQGDDESYNYTLKAISALAYLCEEAAEFDEIATSTLIPAILLFGPDPLSAYNDQVSKSTRQMLREDAVSQREDELLRRMGKFLPFLQGLYNFTLRCQRLVRNMICQIAGCCSAPNPYSYEFGGESFPLFDDVHLYPLAEALATVLRLLITIDLATSSNTDLLEAWDLYKTMVRDRTNQLQDEFISSDMESLSRMLVQLDFSLMSSRCFLTAIEQNLDPGGISSNNGNGSLRTNFRLHKEVKTLISKLYDRKISRLDTNSEITERRDMVGVYGLYALHRRLVPSNSIPDSKLHKQLMKVFPQLCPIVNLIGDLAFFPMDFMTQYAPFEYKGWFEPLDSPIEIIDYVKRFDVAFPSQAMGFYRTAVVWIATADAVLAASPGISTSESGPNGIMENDPPSPKHSVEAKTVVLLQGLVLASRCSVLARQLVTMHKVMNIPLVSSLISPLRCLCEAMKGIEKTICSRRRTAVTAIHYASLRSMASSIYGHFDDMRSVIDHHASSDRSTPKIHPSKVCILNACMSVLEATLKGSSTYSSSRRFIAEIAASVCSDPNLLKGFCTPDVTGINSFFRRLGALANLDVCVRQVCDCSFLYFNQELLPVFLDELLEKGDASGIPRLQLTIAAFSDPERYLLQCTPHLDTKGKSPFNSYVKAYQSYLIDENLKEKLINPVCIEIENDLRISVHSKHLDPFNTENPKINKMRKWRIFLEMPPLQVCGVIVDVKTIVREYLEASFYNLTTVQLHDSNFYTEMRYSAREKYGIELPDNHLPMGSFEQGVDVFEIIMNIQDFVKKFNYNLNQQNFIERRPDRGAKILHTVTSNSITASLRQHGLGILSTAVNSTYKLLSMKFQEFSELLSDDYISSYFSKERRWFRSHKAYPFDRVLTFLRELRKQDTKDDGHTFLDRFRTLLTEIGNALGFVRMIQSAKMNFCSEGILFIPDSTVEFERRIASNSKQSENESQNTAWPCSFSGETLRAAKSVDKVLSTVLQDGIDDNYVQVLLKVFRKVLYDTSHGHLDNFYIMIPALSVSWMEASIRAKEMLHKKNRTRDAYFTDDGFAMGTAFLLGILEQNNLYSGLQWEESVQKKFELETEQITEKKLAQEEKTGAGSNIYSPSNLNFPVLVSSPLDAYGGENDENSDLTTLNVTEKRVKKDQREMEMLFFSLSSSRVFFRDDL